MSQTDHPREIEWARIAAVALVWMVWEYLEWRRVQCMTRRQRAIMLATQSDPLLQGKGDGDQEVEDYLTASRRIGNTSLFIFPSPSAQDEPACDEMLLSVYDHARGRSVRIGDDRWKQVMRLVRWFHLPALVRWVASLHTAWVHWRLRLAGFRYRATVNTLFFERDATGDHNSIHPVYVVLPGLGGCVSPLVDLVLALPTQAPCVIAMSRCGTMDYTQDASDTLGTAREIVDAIERYPDAVGIGHSFGGYLLALMRAVLQQRGRKAMRREVHVESCGFPQSTAMGVANVCTSWNTLRRRMNRYTSHNTVWNALFATVARTPVSRIACGGVHCFFPAMLRTIPGAVTVLQSRHDVASLLLERDLELLAPHAKVVVRDGVHGAWLFRPEEVAHYATEPCSTLPPC